ncbi:MAG: response regulator [Acidobacteriota bacterium]
MLVIEDDEDFRAVICLQLQRAGYQVIDVEDAGAAWDVAREQQLQAVVVDFRLPGIDGRTVARQLRASLPDIPLIGFTSWPDDLAGSTSPFDTVLTKPDVAPLIATLRRFTSRAT